MVVLTITATSNPCTVYFDRPIPKANYVSLLSCSLPNSWHTLKQRGLISLFNTNGVVSNIKTFPEGHYTLETMAKLIEKAFENEGVMLSTEINTPFGDVTITKTSVRRISLNRGLSKFLGDWQRLGRKNYNH